MPQMGVSVSEGTITKWKKQVGDTIEADETLLEISTDKVDTEVPSPASGVVTEILVQEGETVEVGTVLARIGGEAGAAAPRAARARDAAGGRTPPRQSASEGQTPRPRAAEPPPAAAAAPAGVARTASRSSRRSSRASPPSTASTRRRCPAPAHGGRVTKKDIQAFIDGGAQAAPAPAAARRRTRSARTCRASPAAAARTSRAPPASEPQRSGSRRDARADVGDAPRDRRAHAPLARHLGARHERDRGRHVEGRGDPREAEEGVPGRLRRQPDVPRVHRARDGRDAARLPVGERRAPRRQDRHEELRQPRLRGRARRRQGPDRPGRQERRDAQPARHGEGRSPTSRSARATSS